MPALRVAPIGPRGLGVAAGWTAFTLMVAGCGASTDLLGSSVGDGGAAGSVASASGAGDASRADPLGTFGQAGPGDASTAWCDAGPPSSFLVAGVTCGLFMNVPCGLPARMVPEPSGLLAPDSCVVLCPSDRSWESCSLYGTAADGGPGVVVVCVPDCG